MELKPFQVTVMVIFGIIALVGLFLFANFKGFSSGIKPLGSVTVWGSLPYAPVADTLSALKQKHSELSKVTYVEMPEATFDADLANAIAAGRGPDLIITTQEQLATEEDKIVLITNNQTTERFFRDTYLPEAEILLYGKASYGIPFVIDPLMMYYNRTQLSSVGAATAPTTWEAVAGISPALTRLDASGSIVKSGVAFGTYENIENARAILSLLFMQSGSTLSERSQEGIQSTLGRSQGQISGTAPSAAAINYYLQYANPAKTSYTWNRGLPSARRAFIAGDLGIYFGYASEHPFLAAGNPNLDFDMAPVPRPGTLETRVAYGRLYSFAIPKASQNPVGAERTAYLLTGPDVLPTLARSLNMAPAQRQLLVPTQGDLFEGVYYPEALVAQGWLSPSPQKTDELFATMVQSVTSGRQATAEAIGTLAQAISAALK